MFTTRELELDAIADNVGRLCVTYDVDSGAESKPHLAPLF